MMEYKDKKDRKPIDFAKLFNAEVKHPGIINREAYDKVVGQISEYIRLNQEALLSPRHAGGRGRHGEPEAAMKTSDGRESCDGRDFSRAPDLCLDPYFLLLMRERLKSVAGAGWPALRASRMNGAVRPDWGELRKSD